MRVKAQPIVGMFAKWSHCSHVRGHVYLAGLKLFIQNPFLAFQSYLMQKSVALKLLGFRDSKIKIHRQYNALQEKVVKPGRSKAKVCDFHLICQASREEKQPTWSVVIYLSICGKWEVDSLNPTLQDVLILFSHLRRWLKFWTDFKKVYL